MNRNQYIIIITDKETSSLINIALLYATNGKSVLKKLKDKYKNCSYKITEIEEKDYISLL